MARSNDEKERVCSECGRAYAGSQRNIQIYVNHRTEELNKAIWESISGNEQISWKPDDINWVSPKEGKKEKFKEYRDEEFLKKLGLTNLKEDLKQFWPKNGPVWDALATIGDGNGVILVEAKSHPEEVKSDSTATSPESIRKIKDSFEKTKNWLNTPEDIDWTKEYYQYANRIAHLYFLRKAHIEAWLVNIYFLNDQHFPTRFKTKDGWLNPIKKIKSSLGIAKKYVPYMGEVFLLALNY